MFRNVFRWLLLHGQGRQIRGWVVFFTRNFFFVVSIVLALEILFILLGVLGITIPLPDSVWHSLEGVVL